MKNIFRSAAICAAVLAGLSACSSDPIEVPANPAVAVIGGESTDRPYPDLNTPWITGPTSIELDRLYTFTANPIVSGDTFVFTVEDTYFNDPRSYAVNVSTTGTRINVVFNDYGHYKITARSVKTNKTCSYEVAKYYRPIGQLKYVNNGPTLQTGITSLVRPIEQWFERYADYNPIHYEFRSRMTNFEQRLVVNVTQKTHLLWFPWDKAPYMTEADDAGTITGVAAKGADVITLPSVNLRRHPQYNPTTLDNNAYYVPYCRDRVYTIPEERCGRL